MINLITGGPGSGKSYLSIKLLTDKYFFWHKKDKAFYRRSDSKKYTIITNLKDFALEHKPLDDLLKQIPFDQFFSFDYQEKIHQKYPHIIYVIDEIHDWMPPNYKNLDVIKYFSKHRHFGDKVWVITQDFTMIARSLVKLTELEYRAVKATFSIFGEFRYNVKSNGEKFKSITTRKDKRIFKLYTSFQGDDQEQQSNPLKYIIVGLAIAFLVIGYLFFDMITPDPDEAIASPQPQTEQSLTKFRNEKKIKPRSAPLKPDVGYLDPDKKRSVKIWSYVERKNKLYAFECPITHKLLFAHEIPYPVHSVGGDYYIIYTLRQYAELTNETQVIDEGTTFTLSTSLTDSNQ